MALIERGAGRRALAKIAGIESSAGSAGTPWRHRLG